MRLVLASDAAAIARLANRARLPDARVEPAARRIVREVRRGGDTALRRWMTRLDGEVGAIEMTTHELEAGWDQTPRPVRGAIREAARNLRQVATRQQTRPFVVSPRPGVRIEQRVQPFRRVGCYVPGGRYPLPSTLLMTAIPARVAGVEDIIAVCARPEPVVCAAAIEAGVSRVFRIGGAQAIAALAYGTETVPAVDKIVGPGNAWVAAAKRLVADDCAIDMHAGPSEIVVWSSVGRPDWIAADLLAQAEHDPDARAIFVTTRRALADRVASAVARSLPRTGPARRAIARNGAVIIARSRREAVDVVNRLAPEHLVVDRVDDAVQCRTAGTIFVGPWSPWAIV
jgi:histidinol dehydrogenase